MIARFAQLNYIVILKYLQTLVSCLGVQNKYISNDYVQVAKEQMAMQVVDTTNVTRIYSSRDLAALFRLEAPDPPELSPLLCSEDSIHGKPDAYSTSKIGPRMKTIIEKDPILSNVLEGQSSLWITKIGKHQDAVRKNSDDDLSRIVQQWKYFWFSIWSSLVLNG